MGLIVQIIFDIVIAAIAAVLLPILTFGWMRRMPADIAARLSASERHWHGIYRHPSGTIYLGEQATVAVVVALGLSVLVASLALTR